FLLGIQHQKGVYVSVDLLVNELHLSRPFIAKILQILVSKNLLKSRKGVSGGFLLSRDPAAIRILDIIEAVDGDIFDKCVLGFHACNKNMPCLVHEKWAPVKAEIKKVFTEQTLAAGSLEDFRRRMKRYAEG
ncbi:MAG: Rrf2 family transcriptional regulator, partial [Spirochaetia bacterium]|nr:Rrf2 family transcriptional regulator [Spirochaetia bacterium]